MLIGRRVVSKGQDGDGGRRDFNLVEEITERAINVLLDVEILHISVAYSRPVHTEPKSLMYFSVLNLV